MKREENPIHKISSSYMPQLDGLRALAVFAVLCHHYFPESNLNLWANAGVKLFFVLSGFLITGILLKSREISQKKNQSWKFQIRQFYMRRFLRIFPLYYFVIAVGFVIGLEPVREILPWLLTYTLNFYMAIQGWYVDHFAHFWTLAVEEQFYIFWPWFILFAPRKWLVPLCVMFVLTGPFFRLYQILIGLENLEAYILTPACLDSLCMGALLSILNVTLKDRVQLDRILKIYVLPIGAMSLFLLTLMKGERAWVRDTIFFDFASALFFTWLIDRASRGFSGPFGKILQSSILTYIGKISYGLYVYHPFMPRLVPYLFKQLGWSMPSQQWLEFSILSGFALLIASLSWYLMEKPINDLKRHFEYSPSHTAL